MIVHLIIYGSIYQSDRINTVAIKYLYDTSTDWF